MTPEPKSSRRLPSHDEARATIDRARRLRAETLGRLSRAAWSRLAGRPANAVAGARPAAMPHAHA